MATRLKEADVVVVGLGAAGGTAVWPLAQSGMDIVGIEAGPRVTEKDYPFDEIRNDIRDWMGRFKANREVPTTRLNSTQTATRPLGATGPMMNAVGGTSIHWMTQSWRYLPWNFKTRSETIKRYGASAIPAGSTMTDWPFDYNELEPWYDKVEYRHGVSGQAGNVKGKINKKGNIFEGPRKRPYPLPPLRRSGWNELTFDAAKKIGVKPYPGPTGIRSHAYDGFAGCTYCGFCGWTGCWTGAKASTNLHYIPQAEKTGNLKVVSMARVTEVNVDKDGRASGVTYLKGGKEYFQPAKVVMLATYMYENVRLMLLSKSKAYPNGLSNNNGQVGKHYMGHGLASASVMGVFPGRRLNLYSGTIGQYTAIDDWDADNFDHTGMGFIAGGMASATMESKPIGTANTIPPNVPRWGSGYKAWLAANADSVGHARGPDGDALLRGQLRRPRSGGQGRSRPAGAADHVRPQGQRDQVRALDAGPAEGLDDGRRRAEHLDVSARRLLAQHARLRRRAHGARRRQLGREPLADLARGAQSRRARRRHVPDDDRAQPDRDDPGDVLARGRPRRQALQVAGGVTWSSGSIAILGWSQSPRRRCARRLRLGEASACSAARGSRRGPTPTA